MCLRWRGRDISVYTDQDMRAIQHRVRRDWLAIGIAGALFLALYIAALALRVHWLATGAGVLLFVSVAFIAMYYLIPDVRYRGFLRDIAQGLITEMAGSVASIADEAQPQDGVRVLPVHLLLADRQDERIIYLNASKRDRFPGVGAKVRLKLCGRHIVDILEEE